MGELFDTAMVFENYPLNPRNLPMPDTDLRITAITGRDATHYPLTLIACLTPHLRLHLDYRDDLFDRASIHTLASRFIRLLTILASAPEQSVGGIDVLTAGERHRLLESWNDTAVPVPSTCLPALFEAQVVTSPENTAVVFQDTELSYAQLNSEANRLAHQLMALGAGPERIVALALPPCPELIIPGLAVLKAGAACHPPYPARPPP